MPGSTTFYSIMLGTAMLLLSCASKPVAKKPGPPQPAEIKLVMINFLKTGRPLRLSAVNTAGRPLVAVADLPGEVLVYSLPDLMLVKTIPATRPVLGLGFTDNGGGIAVLTGDDAVRIHPLAGGGEPAVLKIAKTGGTFRSLAVSASNSMLALGTSTGELILTDTGGGKTISRKTPLQAVNYLHFSRDGAQLAAAGVRDCLLVRTAGLAVRGTVRLESPPVSFAFSPDNKYLAAGTLFWKVHLLAADSGADKGNLEIDMDPVSSLAFHPERKWLLAGSGKTGKGTLHLLAWPELKVLKKIRMQLEEIVNIASLGAEFLIITSDGTIQILR